MDYALVLASRYLRSKKREFVSVGTLFASLGVALGVAALAIVMSVTGAFKDQFREKVLGVNAHVLVLKYAIDFREYREVMEKVGKLPHVVGISPFIINPMMVTHGTRTATGVLLKGMDPERMPSVLDLPKHVREGTLEGIRRRDSKPAQRRIQDFSNPAFGQAAPGTIGSAISNKDSALLEEIRKSVERDREEPKRPSAPEKDRTEPEKREGVVGEVTPKGGFKSELPDDDLIDHVLPKPCESGTSKLPGLAIGRTLAKQLGAKLDDCVQITSPTIGVSYGATGTRPPIAKQFRIQAIFEAGFDQYDSKLVYTDLYEAQAFYEQGDSVTGLELKVDDISKSEEVRGNIDRVLANGIYRTMDWKQLNHGLFTALLIQQVVMSIVLALIVVVAAFTVIAALVMLVLEKKKEIAVLKSLGATDAAIQRVFLYQGAAIGLAGTLAGLFLGYLGCRFLAAYRFPLDPKVYFISQLPVNLRWNEFLITAVVAFFICLIATVFPARYAASLRPSEGLRPDG